MPRRIILKTSLSPGDLCTLTAAIESLHRSYPGWFLTGVSTSCDELFEANPNIARLKESKAAVIDMHYTDAINCSDQLAHPFLSGYCQDLGKALGLKLELQTNRPHLYVTDKEKGKIPFAELGVPGQYWLMTAGVKRDFTLKQWPVEYYQAVVDHFRGRICFVQIGSAEHDHPMLDGTVNLVGKTNVRQLMALAHHAAGGVGPITFLQHLCAAFEKPYVALLGGREPVIWTQYPLQTTLHTMGKLPCCRTKACWRSRAVRLNDGEEHDNSLCDMPVLDMKRPVGKCMAIIKPEEVIRAIEACYDGGAMNYSAGREARNEFVISTDSATIKIDEMIGRKDVIYPESPSMALVVGTFAAVPYVHLHLEARKRYYPHVPVLVHDDCSPKADELRALCREYGAEFETNSPRFPPCKGDLATFVGRLTWARRHEYDILVKMSRRFIPLMDWTRPLSELALASQYPTFCSHTTTFGFGFRSECVGMGVKAWTEAGAVPEIAQAILLPGQPFVEGFIHQISRRTCIGNGVMARSYDKAVGERPSDRDGYAIWTFIGTDRARCCPGFLWHDAATPADYAAVGREWGLGYGVEDFADPNQGFGAVP